MKAKIKYPRHCKNKRCKGVIVSPRAKNNLCPKCRWRRWNKRNPLAVAFKSLRNHAKERGKEFTLTFAEYKSFAEKTNYLARRGKTSLSLSVDRINNNEGYHFWNIQALTLRENTRKWFVKFYQDQKRYEQEIQRQVELGII